MNNYIRLKFIFLNIIIILFLNISCSDHETFIEIKNPCNLITPIDSEIIYTNKPTFTWESVKGADTYLLYLNQVQYTETGELFYSIPEEQALSEGEYTWQLRSKNEFQYYPCGTKNFSIIIPSAADLQTPLNGECIYTKTPNLQWFDKGGIEYYVVEVSDRKDFSVIIDSSELTETSYTTKPLENGKYYWRVTSYDVNGEVHTSETYSMTINNDFVVAVDLPVPTAISPIESDIYFQPATFTWSSEGIGEHFSYEFELYKNGFEDIVFHASGIQTPLYVLNETEYKLENGTKYNWRVRVVFYTCTGDWCTKNNFNKNAISIAEAISPKDVCLTDDTVVFKWTSGSGILKYKVEIATDSGFSNIIDTIETTNTEYTKLLPNGAYYWRIISYDKNGSEYVSSTYRFVVAKGISTSINISSPNGVNIDSQPLTFTWTGGTLAAPNSYELELSKDDFSTIAYNKTGLVDPSYILNESEYKLLDGSYKWRVRVNYYDCPASDWVTGSFTRICDTWITEDFTVTVTEMGCRSVRFDMNPATFPGLDKYIIQLSGANTNTIDPASSSEIISNLNIGLTDYTVTAKSVDGCTDIVKTGSFITHWEWDYVTGGDALSEDRAYDIKVDTNGNIYIVGRYTGSINLGGGIKSNNGGFDIFIAKYDSNGNYIWDYTVGSSGDDRIQEVFVDSNYDCYLSGGYGGNINFGGGNRNHNLHNDIFVVKLNSSGSYIWDYTASGPGFNIGLGIVADSSGRSYIAGYFAGSINFGSGLITSNSGTCDLFVIRLKNNGTLDWLYTKGASANLYNDRANSITIDDLGNSYITGTYGDDLNFGGVLKNCNGATDIFVLKLNSSGSYVWVYTAGSAAGDYANKIKIDTDGMLYVTGSYSDSINFGNGTRTCNGNNDIFAIKLDNNGNLLKDYIARSINDDRSFGISLDNNYCYITGIYSDTIDFGGSNRLNNGNTDIFAVKLDKNLIYICDYTIGSSDDDYSISVYNYNNNTYIAGFFSNSIDLGDGSVTSTGGNDIFSIKFHW